MGGMPAEAPTTPDALRASDEERDQAVSELSEQFAVRLDGLLVERERSAKSRIVDEGAGAGGEQP